MQGRLAELMAMVAPQTYLKFISFKKGQKILYVKMQKALYGMLKSALLFTITCKVIGRKWGLRSTQMTHAWQRKSLVDLR